MKLSTDKLCGAVLAAAALLLAVTVCGCKAMSDPDGTDLNWAERPEWEFSPAIPSSMLQR